MQQIARILFDIIKNYSPEQCSTASSRAQVTQPYICDRYHAGSNFRHNSQNIFLHKESQGTWTCSDL